jgi:hypothetical protein
MQRQHFAQTSTQQWLTLRISALKIAPRYFADKNLPAASVLTALLTLVVPASVLFRRKQIG